MKVLAGVLLAAAASLPAGTIQQHAADLPWRPASASMPAGAQIAILEGDPQQKRWFTVRLKVPAGSALRPHWHPRDERVTVIAGKVAVGFGETVNEAGVATFGPGSFYVNPANSRHFVLFPEESIVQITGIGPWEVNFVEKPGVDAPGVSPDAAPAR